MSKYYLVDEKELKDLLINYHKMLALAGGGVDNWEWHGYSLWDYLTDYAKELDIVDDDELEDFGFESIAEYELDKYQTYEISESFLIFYKK